MQPRSGVHYLKDLVEALERIDRYTKSMTFQVFSKDERTIDAVIRNIIVIGEAVNKIPETVIDSNPEIPWSSIRGLRNLVVHEYLNIDLSILWETIQQDLIVLLPEMARLKSERTG